MTAFTREQLPLTANPLPMELIATESNGDKQCRPNGAFGKLPMMWVGDDASWPPSFHYEVKAEQNPEAGELTFYKGPAGDDFWLNPDGNELKEGEVTSFKYLLDDVPQLGTSTRVSRGLSYMTASNRFAYDFPDDVRKGLSASGYLTVVAMSDHGELGRVKFDVRYYRVFQWLAAGKVRCP